MCGFSGYFSTAFFAEAPETILKKMAGAIAHRGPDDSGVWADIDHGIGLAHRRLSIVDLSVAGHQPMASRSGRFVIVFNGEIYNHHTLRKQLSEFSSEWNGHSDTETLLAGFDVWGIEDTVKKTTGMFAFAVWDKKTKSLTLGRDRLGEKPLYYGWHGKTFLFGSELKALMQHPEFKKRINHEAVGEFVRFGYIPAPLSIYQDIFKLEPGTLITLSDQIQTPRKSTYWSVSEKIISCTKAPFTGSAIDAVDQLEELISDSISEQMIADVPLGAFLSGGIDSSTVVALMQAQSTQRIKTFTIGFNEEGYNEATHAKAVAKHLGTDHTELYVSAKKAMSVIPHLPSLYDEPFADPSQIPTYLVSELAKQDVTVSLSGDAGDELFCGYNRYTMTSAIWNKISWMPVSLRKAIAKTIHLLPAKNINQLDKFSFISGKVQLLGDKLHKGAGVLASKSVDELYSNIISFHRDPSLLVKGVDKNSNVVTGLYDRFDKIKPVEKMMAVDTLMYLPDDILTKVDRAAMGVSLETRVPFLDHRIVEFAWSLPLEYKLKDGQGKWPLRQVLYRHVPQSLIDRPKMGFGIPLHDWLRGPLKSWAENLLDESRLVREGIFNHHLVRKLWVEHLSEQRNWTYLLWNLLMFQAWYETYQ